VLLAVPLSLLAAFLFAASAALQQVAAHRTASRAAAAPPTGLRSWSWLPVVPLLNRLVRDRVWIAGWLANLAGFFVQAAALHYGSISVVQPLLVAQLLFALPLGTMLNHRQMVGRDWFGAASVCSGLVILLSVRGAAPVTGDADRPSVLLATSAAIVFVLGLVVAARQVHHQPQLRSALISIAAGICFCMSAVFITLTSSDLLHRGVAATATDWPGYALAAAALLGLLLEQDAFAAGSLPTAVAAMTITNPIASYLAGVLAFSGMAPETPGALAGVASAGLLVIVGVLALAQSPNVHEEYAPADQAAGSKRDSTGGSSGDATGDRSARSVRTAGRSAHPEGHPVHSEGPGAHPAG
jgi:drug/metabolite transporter (DMT)-like permease